MPDAQNWTDDFILLSLEKQNYYEPFQYFIVCDVKLSDFSLKRYLINHKAIGISFSSNHDKSLLLLVLQTAIYAAVLSCNEDNFRLQETWEK